MTNSSFRYSFLPKVRFESCLRSRFTRFLGALWTGEDTFVDGGNSETFLVEAFFFPFGETRI